MGWKGSGSTGGGGVTFAPPTAVIDVGDVQNEGASPSAARADHQHSFPAGGAAPALAVASTAGAASTPARSDHTHAHTAAQHRAGGHADLSGDFDAAGAAAAAQADAAANLATHAGAADPHAGYLLESLADALGDLLAATGPDAWTRVPRGPDGQVLTADAAQVAGVKWAPPSLPASGIPGSIFDALGDLLAGTGPDAYARVAVGADGQVLTADAAQAAGVKWGDAPGAEVLIAEQVLAATAAAVTFSSIPATYRALVLRVWLRHTTAGGPANVSLRINSDSTSGHYGGLYFNPSGAGAMSTIAQPTDQLRFAYSISTDGAAGEWGYGEARLPRYADANEPILLGFGASRYPSMYYAVGGRAVAEAVTALTVLAGAGSFAIGSRLQLWGVR